MKRIKDWIDITLLTFGVVLFVLFLRSVIIIGFDFSNISAKLLILLAVLSTLVVVAILTLRNRTFRNHNAVSTVLFLMFWGLLFGNLLFADKIFQVKKEYVGIHTRETNNQDYTWETEYNEHGGSYEYKDYYYTDLMVKQQVVKIDSEELKEIKDNLKVDNDYIAGKEYKYWQAAIVDGFKSKNNATQFEEAFYYFLELANISIPSILIVLILNGIVQIITGFKYSLLDSVCFRTQRYREEFEGEIDEDYKLGSSKNYS